MNAYFVNRSSFLSPKILSHFEGPYQKKLKNPEPTKRILLKLGFYTYLELV